MKWRELIGESWRSMLASRVPSVIIAVLCAAMCAAAILTVGRSAAADSQLERRLEAAGARLVEISASSPDIITTSAVNFAQSLNTVSQVIGVHRMIDVSNAAIGPGTPTPAAIFTGAFSDVATLNSGRLPQPNEALVTAQGLAQLGFDGPIGALSDSAGNSYAVVGTYTPKAPFDDLGMALISADPANERSLATIRLVATTAADSGNALALMLHAIDAAEPNMLTVSSPATLAALKADLRNDFGDYSRSLFLMILLGGGTLLGVVVFADTLLHRTDFGRRRALGISRAGLTTLVTLRTLWAAMFGVALGSAGAWLYSINMQTAPPGEFVAGVSVLVLLFCVLFASLPAVLTAFRDPVSVLRTA